MPDAPLRYVRPGWILFDSPDRVEVVDFLRGARIAATGMLREALTHSAPSYRGTLFALSQHDANLARLCDDLRHGSHPLDRAELLRGTGFDTLFLELGAQCNQRCIHCYAESSPDHAAALPWPLVQAVLEDAATLEFQRVQLTGGDPLLSDLLLPAVDHAFAVGIPSVEIFTNGMALRGSLLEDLLQPAVQFALSVYSFDASTHDSITRTAGSHAATVDALRLLVAHGAAVRASITAMPENESHVADTVQFLQDIGLERRAVAVNAVRSVGRASSASPLASSGQSAYEAEPQAEHDCRAFSGRAAVSFHGTVYPCIFARHIELGSVRRARLRQVLTEPIPIAGDSASVMRAVARERERLTCIDCQLRAALLGGGV